MEGVTMAKRKGGGQGASYYDEGKERRKGGAEDDV